MTPCIVCASTLTILISANGAAAQTGSALYSTRLDTRVTTSAFLVTFGTTYLVHVYEGRSTTNAIEAGAREANPLVAPFTSGPGMFAFSVARATAINAAVASIGKRHKFWAIGIGAALNYSYLYIADRNNTVAADMRRQRRRLGR